MNLRDWLIVIGVIIIMGILIDGYRRMRLARKDSLQISSGMKGEFESTHLDEVSNPELPGEGVRVVAKGSDSTNTELNPEPGTHQPETFLPESQKMAAGDSDSQNENDDEILVAEAENRVDLDTPVQTVPTAHAAKRAQNKVSGNDQIAGQEVVIINVHSRPEKFFSGEDINKLLQACGMEHGDMSIFHRHEEDDLLSPIQFSVANSVEPGVFDPETLEQSVTPGVSFFMSLPGPKDYMRAFDYMLETAQCFAKNLGGELKDEHRSVMTSQTIEHCRQRIREFERKQLSKISKA